MLHFFESKINPCQLLSTLINLIRHPRLRKKEAHLRYIAPRKRFSFGGIIWRSGAFSEGNGQGRQETGREIKTDRRFAKLRIVEGYYGH